MTVAMRCRRPAIRSAVSAQPGDLAPCEPRIGTRPMALPSRPPTVSTSSSSMVDVEELGEVVDVHARPAPGSRAVAELLDLGRLAVVLVGDLADDLLEDVLDGDQARRCRRTRRRRWRSGSGRAASRAAGRRPACSRARSASAASARATGTAPASGSALSAAGDVLEVEQARRTSSTSSPTHRDPGEARSAGTATSPAGSVRSVVDR